MVPAYLLFSHSVSDVQPVLAGDSGSDVWSSLSPGDSSLWELRLNFRMFAENPAIIAPGQIKV